MITDARALRQDHVPRELYHREGKLEQISTALEPVSRADPGEDILIHGPSGTGKTTLAKYLLSEFERETLDVDTAIAGFDGVEDQFVWEFYDGVPDVRAHWSAAYRRFADDYEDHYDTDRYVQTQLPDLPFDDDSFSLVLSAHLMFLYVDTLDHEFHGASLLELARVAREEVRVYPLARFDGKRYPRLDELRETLSDAGYATEIRPISFEFLREDPEMLVVEV